MLKQTRLVTVEQQPAFEQWYEDQGFAVVEDVTDRCYDAATELLAAIADYIKLRTMNPAEPPSRSGARTGRILADRGARALGAGLCEGGPLRQIGTLDDEPGSVWRASGFFFFAAAPPCAGRLSVQLKAPWTLTQ